MGFWIYIIYLVWKHGQEFIFTKTSVKIVYKLNSYFDEVGFIPHDGYFEIEIDKLAILKYE